MTRTCVSFNFGVTSSSLQFSTVAADVYDLIIVKISTTLLDMQGSVSNVVVTCRFKVFWDFS